MEKTLMNRYYLYLVITTILIAVNTYVLIRAVRGEDQATYQNEELIKRFKDQEKVLIDSLQNLRKEADRLKCLQAEYEKERNNLEVVYIEKADRIKELSITESASELKKYLNR